MIVWILPVWNVASRMRHSSWWLFFAIFGRIYIQRIETSPTPPAPSFPQFVRLPAELQLQILGHHRDSVRRHHRLHLSGVMPIAPGVLRNLVHYSCIDPSSGRVEKHAAENHHDQNVDPTTTTTVVRYVYENDGLASERIPVCCGVDADGTVSVAGVWASFGVDVFFFFDRFPTPRDPGPSLGALRADPQFAADAEGRHWFWRV
ncbi:hypothetical protein PG999_014272 [Apiospora kogelbergensis]|uniref:YD repeat-containing protein n=1 Tax=Apiospora kogelbergensis TaxID=1337665 RepID=A0AAW0QHT1_9PEZI